jgi:hypothetical protein
MARTKLQCMLVSHQGIGGASELRERSAELTQLDIVRLELHRLAKGLRRFLLPSLPLQRGSKARQIMRLGVLSDRVRDPLYQVMVLFGVEEQQTHQVQRVRMIGIRCKRLLAAESSIAVSSALHVGKAGLMDRRRGTYPPLVNCPGATAGSTAGNRRFL